MKKDCQNGYNYKEIAPNIYIISEFNISTCYLVIGSKKALLIDCGSGADNLPELVRTLTDLPVILAATHGHVDHIGGAPPFKEVFLHSSDHKMVKLMLKLRKPFLMLAKKVLNIKNLSLKNIPLYKSEDLILKPINNGAIFDLGGRTVTVYHTPGHTPGSVIFRANEDNLLFTGDNLNMDLWLQLPFCMDVETWLRSAEYTAKLMKKQTVYFGHAFDFTPHETIMSTIELGRKILRENSKNSTISKFCKIKDKKTGVDIQYRSGNIYK